MNAIKIVKEYFPDTDDNLANTVLFGCTGWPGFFIVPVGKTKEDVLREQLKQISELCDGDAGLALHISDEMSEEQMSKIDDAPKAFSKIQQMGPSSLKISYFNYPDFASILVQSDKNCILFRGVAYKPIKFNLSELDINKDKVVESLGQDNYDKLVELRDVKVSK